MERIRQQLTRRFGKGTQYTIGGIGSGLMYGNDECLDMHGRLYQYFSQDGSNTLYKCYYTIPEGETDWSNIDYSSPEDIEISDSWGYPE